jgi:hypothetical protein
MIDRSRWQRLSRLFDDCVALPQAQRPLFVEALRGDDEELAHQLQRMLDEQVDAEVTAPMSLPVFDHWLAQALEPAPLPSPESLAGRVLGAWRLVGKIGEGGMGQVWLAERCDGLYEARAAIKLLRNDMPPERLMRRFARERAVLGRLNHPAIARLLDAGISGGRPYLVLEHVEGQPLVDFVRLRCPALADRVRLLIRIAEAVDYAHALLVVHRDLKPSNVMVTAQGEVKLLDFGIAGLLDEGLQTDDLTRQTGRGLTLGYAAPEQILGQPIGTPADVFSLGTILFELISGALPFGERGVSRMALEHAILHREPRRLAQVLGEAAGGAVGPPDDVALAYGDLEAVVAKTLRKDPTERYAHVGVLIDDLERWLTHRVVSVRRDDKRHRLGLWLRRHRLLAWCVAVVVLTLVAALATSTWQWRRATVAARQSDRVTSYLTELLSTASPNEHGQKWPTVMEILDKSRRELDAKFGDDAETHLRISQVLARTYDDLGQQQTAAPLREQIAERTLALYGARDRRTLEAQVDLAKTYQFQRTFDKSLAVALPIRARARSEFGERPGPYLKLLGVIGADYAESGRLADAEQPLNEFGRIVDARSTPGDPDWMTRQNNVAVLRALQGRLREGLAAMQAQLPYIEASAGSHHGVDVAVFRVNELVMRSLLSDAGVEESGASLLAQADKASVPGNEQSYQILRALAMYEGQVGRNEKAFEMREDIVRRLHANPSPNAARLPQAEAAALAWRSLAFATDRATAEREARAMLARVDAQRDLMPEAKAEVWKSIASLALVYDDAALAADSLARLHADRSLRLDSDRRTRAEVARLDGGLARLRGDLARSGELLAERLRFYDGSAEKTLAPIWSATLDLAYTQVLQANPAAGDSLRLAATRRPPTMPPDTPLDAVAGYLGARLKCGTDDAAPVQSALAALARAQHREVGDARAGKMSLGGAFF